MRVENGNRYYERKYAPDGSVYFNIGDIVRVGDKVLYKASSERGARTEDEARRLIGL